PMRRRSPSLRMRCGLACSPLTSTLPPSQARLASERVLKRQATSSQTSRRTASLTARPWPSDQDLDLALGPERADEGLRRRLPLLILQILLDLSAQLVVERDGRGGLLLRQLDDVVPELGLDEVRRL